MPRIEVTYAHSNACQIDSQSHAKSSQTLWLSAQAYQAQVEVESQGCEL